MVGTVKSPEKAQLVRQAGAEAVALDLLDAAAVRAAVLDAHPDAIVHQATALANERFDASVTDPRVLGRPYASC